MSFKMICHNPIQNSPIFKENNEENLRIAIKNKLLDLNTSNSEIKEKLDKFICSNFISEEDEEILDNSLIEIKKNIIVSKNLINELGDVIKNKCEDFDSKDNLLLIHRQTNKKLETAVECFNKNNSLFNLIKSKKILDKSSSELSERLILENNLKKKQSKKLAGNVLQIQHLYELVEERRDNIEKLNEKAIYIQKINKDINDIVNRQGHIIDKIADNIEPTTINSKDTFTNLLIFSKSKNLNAYSKCYLFMLVVAFLFFFLIILMNKLRN